MKISYGRTHTGLVRSVNEDCFGIFPIGKYATLYAVCDGVGGCAAGERASALALSAFSDFILDQFSNMTAEEWGSMPLAQIKRIMRAAATDASHRVHTAAAQDPALMGMASTLVAALVTDNRAYVIHVGDSRLYTVTPQSVEKVTRDHSYIQYLIDVGRITKAQAKAMKIENYITQAIGAYDHVDGDFCALDLSTYPPDTYLLLCSDGLYNYVKKPLMRSILTSPDATAHKAEALIRAACEGGGEDNITAVIVAL